MVRMLRPDRHRHHPARRHQRDRPLREPLMAAIPKLAGLAELAGLAGVSRQRAGQIASHPDFPEPVQPERRAIGDLAAPLDEELGVLNVNLAIWMARDDTRPQPEAREAANTAVDAIDAMLRELHAMRSRLVTEMRAADDATGRRVDDLLARSRRAAAQVTEGSDG